MRSITMQASTPVWASATMASASRSLAGGGHAAAPVAVSALVQPVGEPTPGALTITAALRKNSEVLSSVPSVR